jgi:hypothetical protein
MSARPHDCGRRSALESYARERDIHVMLERVSEREQWVCELRDGAEHAAVRTSGGTAREAIMEALRQEGVDLPH